MTKLQIISRLWASIYDLLMLIKGTGKKPLEDIERNLDSLEMHCRKYEDEDDFEFIGTKGGNNLERARDEPNF